MTRLVRHVSELMDRWTLVSRLAWAAAAPVATAQLGVPAAVVSLGLQEKVLTAAQGAAIITTALASLGIAALGTTLVAREARQVGDNAASETTAVAERA